MRYKGIDFVILNYFLNLTTKTSEHFTMNSFNTFNFLFYLRTDRKKDVGLVKRLRKQITKFEIQPEQLGFITT